MRYSKKITVPTVVSATARLSSLTRIQPSREQYISTTMFLPPCFYHHVSTAMFLPPCFYRHVSTAMFLPPCFYRHVSTAMLISISILLQTLARLSNTIKIPLEHQRFLLLRGYLEGWEPTQIGLDQAIASLACLTRTK